MWELNSNFKGDGVSALLAKCIIDTDRLFRSRAREKQAPVHLHLPSREMLAWIALTMKMTRRMMTWRKSHDTNSTLNYLPFA